MAEKTVSKHHVTNPIFFAWATEVLTNPFSVTYLQVSNHIPLSPDFEAHFSQEEFSFA